MRSATRLQVKTIQIIMHFCCINPENLRRLGCHLQELRGGKRVYHTRETHRDSYFEIESDWFQVAVWDKFPRVLRLPFRSEHSRCCSHIYLQSLFQVDYQSLMLLSRRTRSARNVKEISTLIESTSDFHSESPSLLFCSRMPRARWPANSHGSLVADK